MGTAHTTPQQDMDSPQPSKRTPSAPPTDSPGRLGIIWSVLKETATDWSDDKAARLAAALAFYTLLSIAPLTILSVAIAGLAFGDEAARGQIAGQIESVVGPQAAEAIQSMAASAQTPSSGIVSSIIGIVVLLFGASGVFGELQSALDEIWEVEPKPGRGILGVVKDRFFSFTMVMGVAFLLMVSLVISAALAAIGSYFEAFLPSAFIWQIVNLAVSLGVSTVLFALMYKVVPDAKVAWRDVWMGGFVTAVLFTVGKLLLGLYIGRASVTSSYGAAGSLVALILWVYYSAQIFFLGAEFTQVFARRFGSKIVPTSNAVAKAEASGAPAQAGAGAAS